MPSRPNSLRLKRPWMEWGCLLLASLLIVGRQFTNPNFASCVTDDSILHMSWVRQFTQVLSEGVWLPRWMPDSNGGYGSPVFVFYSPLVYYLTAVTHWVTGSVVLSMKLTRLMGLFFSGLGMFSYVSRLADRKTALVTSLIYLAIPFHVLDISYWTLYAEPWAWVWFPLILMFLHKTINQGSGSRFAIHGFAACYAGLILSHLVSAFMFSFMILGYVLAAWKKCRPQILIRIAAGVVLGLAFAAFFLLPAYYERRFVHIDYVTLLPEFNFRNTFLFFPNSELIGADLFQGKTIHLLQVVTLLQAIWAVIALVLTITCKNQIRYLRDEFWFAGGVAFSCLFLMSCISAWVWELVPGLAKIQFSTRWLSIYSWATALIVGASFINRGSQKVGTLRWFNLAYFASGLLAFFATLTIIFKGCFLSEEHTELALAGVQNAPEYNPLVMPDWERRVIVPQDPPVTIVSGEGRVQIIRWEAHHRSLRLEAKIPVRLRIRLFDYPGWSVTMDSLKVQPMADPKQGGMMFDVSEGQHQMEIRFLNTWWRNVGVGVSLAALCILLGKIVRVARNVKFSCNLADDPT